MFPDLQTVPTPTDEYRAHFGDSPGSQDAKTECQKWQQLCAELLLERERLRMALVREQALHERAVLKLMCAEVPPDVTMEQVYAQVERGTSLEQIIADLKQGQETAK